MNKVDINLIADYTVLKLHKKDIDIIPLQLQKLLYYIQAWHMVYFGRENTLFDEVPKAFMCGAIYPTIYKRYEQREGLKPFEASDRDISLDSMYSFYKKRLKHGA